MSLRFTSQLQVDNLPDEQIEDQFEVIMPELELNPTINDDNPMTEGMSTSGWWSRLGKGLIGMSYRPIVEEIIFGPRKFITDTRRVRTGWYNVPKDIDNYSDVQITMFCPNTMQTQYYLEAWKALMFNEEGEYYRNGNVYKKNIEVYIYGPGGNGLTSTFIPSLHYTLQGCFPYLQTDYKLQYTNDPRRLRISAMFKVDKVVLDKTSSIARGITELITSPTSILDKLITSSGLNGAGSIFNDSTQEYNIEKVYGDPTKKLSSSTSKVTDAVKKVTG